MTLTTKDQQLLAEVAHHAAGQGWGPARRVDWTQTNAIAAYGSNVTDGPIHERPLVPSFVADLLIALGHEMLELNPDLDANTALAMVVRQVAAVGLPAGGPGMTSAAEWSTAQMDAFLAMQLEPEADA